jgi:hypothetical protein
MKGWGNRHDIYFLPIILCRRQKKPVSLKAAWFQYIIENPRPNYTAPGFKCLDICPIFNKISAIPPLRKKMTSQWRNERVKSGKKKYFILL